MTDVLIQLGLLVADVRLWARRRLFAVRLWWRGPL